MAPPTVTDMLVGRGQVYKKRGSCLSRPRILRGRYLPFNSHYSEVYSHQHSAVNEQKILVFPIVDLNVLNQLYSPRYLQQMKATFDGSAWKLGPTYHWLLRMDGMITEAGSVNSIFSTRESPTRDLNFDEVDPTTLIHGPSTASINAHTSQRISYTRGVMLKGYCKWSVTLRNNGTTINNVILYETYAKNLKGLASSSSSVPWWSNQFNGMAVDSTRTEYSEKDLANYDPVNPNAANTNVPSDFFSANPMNRPEFSLETISTDSTFGNAYGLKNRRSVTLAPGQTVTIHFKSLDWHFKLANMIRKLTSLPVPVEGTDVYNFLTNTLVPGINYGLVIRTKGSISHDSETHENVGIDRTELDINIKRNFKWSLKADDQVTLPTRGIVTSDIIIPQGFTPFAVNDQP